jgi:hypothetical protein
MEQASGCLNRGNLKAGVRGLWKRYGVVEFVRPLRASIIPDIPVSPIAKQLVLERPFFRKSPLRSFGT